MDANTLTPATANQGLAAFSSPLGWIAMIGRGKTLMQLVFGHRNADAAVRSLDPDLREAAAPGPWSRDLAERLRAYAEGEAVDFADVRVDQRHLADFARRVQRHCRRIPYGQTLSYGELASAAGSAGAARAVGSCMARNRTPLVVPCHRVVAAGGRIGAFSAPGGSRTKRRLLALESGSDR